MNTQSTAKITDLIHFHGITLLVTTYENIKYVLAKPIVDLTGIDWRSAKKQLLEDFNKELYGSRHISTPVNINQFHETPKSEKRLYIRLDRARLYVVRLSSARMHKTGNLVAAEKLLKLQIEMGDALSNEYRQEILAEKYQEQRNEVKEWARIRNSFSENDAEYQVITKLIHQRLQEIGFPPEDAIN